MIFYVFNSFDENVAELHLNNSRINLLVSITFAFLLLYANLFMIRQRRAEFMTLSTLGMSLRKIISTICIETIVVIVLSLVIGIPSGIFVSQITHLFVRYFMYGSSEGYAFKISGDAIRDIISIYAIIIFFVCLFNTLFVGRIKLYLLLKEDYVRSKRLDQTGYLHPTVLLIISLVIVAFNRFLLVDRLSALTPMAVVIAFVLAIVSIFLMVRSAFMYLNAFAASDKGLKYAFEVRFITDSGHELSYFMTAVSVIILMSFILVAGSFGIINNLRKFSMVDVPCDVMIMCEGSEDIRGDLDSSGIDSDIYLSSYTQVNLYHDIGLTYGDLCGEDSYLFKEYIFIDPDSPMDIMTVTDYNKIASMSGLDHIDLKDGEFLLSSDIASIKKEFNRYLRSTDEITVNGITLRSVSSECADLTLFLGLTKTNPSLIIVPDHVIAPTYTSKTFFLGFLRSPEVESEFLDLVYSDANLPGISITTTTMLREDYRDMTFRTLYLSFYTSCVFVICSMAVLSFKEMITIGSRLSMIRSLTLMGFPDEEIRRYFICHITTIFAIPAIASFMHSGYMIRAINRFVEAVGEFDIASSYMVFSLFLFPILFAFSMMTYKTSSDLCFRVRSNRYGRY